MSTRKKTGWLFFYHPSSTTESYRHLVFQGQPHEGVPLTHSMLDELRRYVLGMFLGVGDSRPITRLVSHEFSQRFALVTTSMRHDGEETYYIYPTVSCLAVQNHKSCVTAFTNK